jgi:hypothetical protein
MKSDIQAELFKLIKTKLSGQDSLGNALSDILHLSPDAVYRRYRGETSLTIQETKRLCQHFDVSFDALAQLSEGKVIFQYPPLNTYDFSLESYLEGIAESFKRIKKLTNAEMYISVSNTHFFQILNFPQLVRFRLFFWAKTHLQIEAYKEENFKHEKTSDRAFELGKEILQLYNSIPSVEIFDPELMRGFMRQILYYYKAHMFEDPEYALFLCDRALLFSKHLKEQATLGKKFIYGTVAPNSGNDFSMYLNETVNSDTTFYYSSKESDGIFVTHNVMNYLHTNAPSYVADSKQIIDKQLANSSLISQVNEKERNNYFYDFEKMILSFRKKIEADLYF